MTPTFRVLTAADVDALIPLHMAYKAEIGEEAPTAEALIRLREAIGRGDITFYGCEAEGDLLGVCSVTRGFSTFNYQPSGVLEDFYILPAHRHRGLARGLVRFAREQSGVGSLTVGCADCDRGMYAAIGFSLPLGSLLAWEDEPC